MSENQLTPGELKEATLADYKAGARARGIDVPAHEMDQIVKNDLEMVDRYNQMVADMPKRPERKPDPGRQNAAVKYAEKRGMHFFKEETPEDTSFKDMVLSARPGQYGPKFDAMMQRILRIIQVVGTMARGNASAAIDATEDRKLARETMMKIMQYRQWNIGKERNPYYMPAKDRGRKFLRDLEDICDRSTAAYGPWWVK
jgi:hypothetical protein